MTINSRYVCLHGYEGPLDLLLELIKHHQLDIFNVNLYFLVEQYLQCLKAINYEDLDDAGAFLIIASTLIKIKSKYLLPKNSKQNSQTNHDDFNDLEHDQSQKDLDENEELKFKKRLFDLQTFKKAAEFLSKKNLKSAMTYKNHEHKRLGLIHQDTKLPLKLDCYMLVVLYEQALSSLADIVPKDQLKKKYNLNLDDLCDKFFALLKTKFFLKLDDLYPYLNNRQDLIISFLSFLQMTKKGAYLYQQNIDSNLSGSLYVFENKNNFKNTDIKKLSSKNPNKNQKTKTNINTTPNISLNDQNSFFELFRS